MIVMPAAQKRRRGHGRAQGMCRNPKSGAITRRKPFAQGQGGSVANASKAKALQPRCLVPPW